MGRFAITRDKADDLFSKYVRLRDRKCLRCLSSVRFNDKGMPVSHEASHFQGRRKENTRFDPENVCTLCTYCHQRFTENPAEHTEWQVKRLGLAKVEEIVLRSSFYKKRDRKMEVIYWTHKLKADFGI